MKPCDLLTDAQLQQLGFSKPGHVVHSSQAPTCNWEGSAGGITAGIRTHQGLDDFDLSAQQGAQPAKSLTLAGHKAKLQRSTRDCAVGIAVSPHSRVDVLVTTLHEKDWCAAAKQVATVIAGNLPKS